MPSGQLLTEGGDAALDVRHLLRHGDSGEHGGGLTGAGLPPSFVSLGRERLAAFSRFRRASACLRLRFTEGFS